MKKTIIDSLKGAVGIAVGTTIGCCIFPRLLFKDIYPKTWSPIWKQAYIIYRLWSENDHLSRIGGNQFSTFLYCNRNKEEVSKCKLKSS